MRRIEEAYPLPKHSPFRELVKVTRLLLHEKGISSVLLGLSGGPDSVVAFHILRAISLLDPDFRFGIAHANFNLRGEESLRDEEFVRTLLRRFPIDGSISFRRFDTLDFCSNEKISVEMGARRLRHDWFDAIMLNKGFDRIATGHNADDNEETMLLNLLRGSGSRGLRGMEQDNGRIIRPLLHIPRPAILKIADEIGILTGFQPCYIMDSSNLTDDYRRNFLRHKILPLLGTRWEGYHSGLQRSLRCLSEEARIVERALNQTLTEVITTKDGELLPWKIAEKFPSPLTLVNKWLENYDLSSRMEEEIADVISKVAGERRIGAFWKIRSKRVLGKTSHSSAATDSSGDAKVEENILRVTSGGLMLTPLPKPWEREADILIPSGIEWEHISFGERTMDQIAAVIRSAGPDIAWLPSSPECYEWRYPLKGEKMHIGPKSSKRISDILKEAGIAAPLRSATMILADILTGHAVWIPGIRRGWDSLVDPRSMEAWRVSLSHADKRDFSD